MDDERPVKITISLDLETYMTFKLLAQQIGVSSNNLCYTAIVYFLSALKKNGFY